MYKKILGGIFMELLDIYNKEGEKLNYSISREVAHREGLWHKIACMFIINSKNEVLMQKRSHLKKTNPNGWGCSASGHIDAGENIITGALRELEEEIGVYAKEKDLEYIGTVFENYDTNNMKIAHISEVYLIHKDIVINDLTLQEEEVSDAKFYTISEAEKTDFAKKHKGIFELLKSNI